MDYTKEFKEQLVKEASEVGNIAMVAKRHSIDPSTLRYWMKMRRKTSRKPNGDAELKELRSNLKDAQLENAILKELLKKTNQLWMNESPSLGSSSQKAIQCRKS